MKPQSAMLAGEEGDGLVTNELDLENLKNKVLPAFRKGAEKSGKDYNLLTKAVFIPASYDQDKEKAIKSIAFWKGAMIKAFFEVDVHDPREIQENGQVVGDDTMQQMAFVVSNAEEGIKKIKQYTEIGFTDIVLINSSPDRNNLVRLLSKEVIPQVRG
jgi:alkanesulfonate monooxygenase SsuD/methylene tetrahydromethanopterin reductase-like flavin-dependent oxidoreductase (luciferase family)